MKIIEITFDDGERWQIPLEFVARHRAIHLSDDGHDFKEERDFVLNDDYEGIDWLQNMMEYEDFKEVLRRIPAKSERDFSNAKAEIKEKELNQINNSHSEQTKPFEEPLHSADVDGQNTSFADGKKDKTAPIQSSQEVCYICNKELPENIHGIETLETLNLNWNLCLECYLDLENRIDMIIKFMKENK